MKVDVIVYWNAQTSAEPVVNQTSAELDSGLDQEQFTGWVLDFLKRKYGTSDAYELDTILVEVEDSETGDTLFSDLVCLDSSYVLQRWRRYEQNLHESREALCKYLQNKNSE